MSVLEIEQLVNVALVNRWSVADLLALFEINHDRYNNGGVFEVISLAIQDGDDPDWIIDLLEAGGKN